MFRVIPVLLFRPSENKSPVGVCEILRKTVCQLICIIAIGTLWEWKIASRGGQMQCFMQFCGVGNKHPLEQMSSILWFIMIAPLRHNSAIRGPSVVYLTTKVSWVAYSIAARQGRSKQCRMKKENSACPFTVNEGCESLNVCSFRREHCCSQHKWREEWGFCVKMRYWKW